eukprot:TRINITY_DN5791_c0_g1_i6.p1 TRINITY_DN5791_c0_g1~~TRINITY_DN5791_c0_g1_i6.p1  ORF type:complete len:604 (-),score=127.65 TRINITY_DN5791_c0_g1_i6:239-2050(-)
MSGLVVPCLLCSILCSVLARAADPLSGKHVLVVDTWLENTDNDLLSADGLLCEFALTHNVTLDLILPAWRRAMIRDPFLKVCIREFILLAPHIYREESALASMADSVWHTRYHAVVTTSEDMLQLAQAIALAKGLAPFLRATGSCTRESGNCLPLRGHEREADTDTSNDMSRDAPVEEEEAHAAVAAMRSACDDTCTVEYLCKWEIAKRVHEHREHTGVDAPPLAYSLVDLRTCSITSPDSIEYPAFIKYSYGVFASGGVNGNCLRMLGYASSREELEARLSVFCHPLIMRGARLPKPTALVAPFLSGSEVYGEFIVYHGKVLHLDYKLAACTCKGRRTYIEPAVLPGGIVVGHYPGLEQEAPSGPPEDARAHERMMELSARVTAECDQLLAEVAEAAGLWNMYAGFHVMIDWRSDTPSCQLVEVNPRPPANVDMFFDTHFRSSHHAMLFHPGAVLLYLALDLDPSPLFSHTNPAQHSTLMLSLNLKTKQDRENAKRPDFWTNIAEGMSTIVTRPSPFALAEAPELVDLDCPLDLDFYSQRNIVNKCPAQMDWIEPKLMKRLLRHVFSSGVKNDQVRAEDAGTRGGHELDGANERRRATREEL